MKNFMAAERDVGSLNSGAPGAEPASIPHKIRVAMLLDGSEAYGVLEFVRRLLGSIDRTRFHVIGIFLGRGRAREVLGEYCDELEDLRTGCLLPLTIPGKSKYYAPNIVAKSWLFAKAVSSLVSAIYRCRPHVVHANYYPVHWVAGLACRLTGVPSVWHLHGSFPLGRVRRILAAIGYSFLAKRIVCISRFTATTLPGIAHWKASVVYNGVDALWIAQHQRKGELRRRLEIPESSSLVGIFGSLNEYKGHEFFLEAAAAVLQTIPDVYFVIVGGETEVQRHRFGREAKLRRLIQTVGISHRVMFCPYLKDACLYMADCDIICVPTIPFRIGGEGFGLVTAEAMAAGVPVVATNCGATPELIEDGRGGLLVPPRDGQELAAAIIRVLSDRELACEYSRAARQRVLEVFSVGQMARGMEVVYSEAASWRTLCAR